VAVPELRSEVIGLCDKLQAILAFNYQYPAESRGVLDAIRRDAPTAPARWLRERRDRLRAEVRNAVKEFGLRGDVEEFAKAFKENSRKELGIMLQPKFAIDQMFSNYTDGWVDWRSYPPHLLVYLDYTAESHRPQQFDWRLAETSLYEDMCIAYNLALDSANLASTGAVKIPHKKLTEFCVRSAVLNAFYFVEAYMNGIAFDFWIRNAKNIADDDAEALLEWDSKGNREKWLNFKDKLYRYPRIIMGTKHPPLTESNSAEVKLLLTKAKEVRDSIVHQSPKVDLNTGLAGQKLTSFMHLRPNDATEVVDAAVSLVAKLNALLGKNGIKLDWLVPRDPTGRFPEAAFR
jgi:hypothetical protein